MRGGAIFAVSLLAGACDLGERKEPGENLGMFDVVATMAESSCGTGALNAPAIWEFQVKLVREGTVLYWLNGAEYIPGEFASDGVTFSFATSTQVRMSEPTAQSLGCVITRIDAAQGILTEADPTGETQSSFTGTLSYGYIAGQDGDCSAVVGVEGGFSALPCDIAYDLSANVAKLEE